MVPAYEICIMLENGLTSNRLTANTVGYYNCGKFCDIGGTSSCASPGYCTEKNACGACNRMYYIIIILYYILYYINHIKQ